MSESVLIAIPRETVNDESVRLLAWLVGEGTRVEKDQPVCEVETSKAVMEIEAPIAGVVVYRAVAGDEVAVGATICEIVPDPSDTAAGCTSAEHASVANVRQESAGPLQATASGNGNGASPNHGPLPEELRPARLTPLATKLAAELGLQTESFPRGSLVRRDDVLRRAGKLPPEQNGFAPAPPSIPADSTNRSAENNPVPGVAVEWTELPRRKVFEAKVLGRSLVVQSQVSRALRPHGLRGHLERLGLGPMGLTAVTIFETSRLLRKYPEFNAVHDRGRMGTYTDVNVGWALDGGQGLTVPVVLHADRKTAQEIVAVMQTQMERYVEGTLATSDFLGGTFTVSDLSREGIGHFEPLISQGQSAILGIGAESDERSGKETFYLTLAFDHQLTEGRKAAQLLRDLASRLEIHAANQPFASQADADAKAEPYCCLCGRGREALRPMKAILVRSEIPAGCICSICLAGL